MEEKTRKRVLCTLVAVVLTLLLIVGGSVWCVLAPNYKMTETQTIYIRPQHTEKDVLKMLDEECGARQLLGWKLLSLFVDFIPRTGAYAITPEVSTLEIFRHLRNGRQQPVRWTLPMVRGLNELAASISQHLMLDSAAVMNVLTDSAALAPYGYTPESVYALFIPNTYEFYWDVPLEKFMKRMCDEHDKFWIAKNRLTLAAALHLTPVEVTTLASIVDEETAYGAEKSRIAGLYLNRLRKGMRLQADPTVKFSVGDASLRRIRKGHLKHESPYNTYLYKGLPPGPIRIASIQGIDAVLHAEEHPYLYMCAREDFSGAHNFAASYADHQRNARRYSNALNMRGVE